jgi:prophage DNA circulation protein
MAWADMLVATFRGVAFDCQTISDSAQRAQAQHTYPYRDGADIEDLGRGPRTMRVRAIFWGDDYLARLTGFGKVLDTKDSGELIHPIFGSIPDVQVADFDIQHEAEGVNQASITITFIESASGVSFFVDSTASQDVEAIESVADNTLDAGTNVLADQLGEITGLADAVGFDAADGAALSLADVDFASVGRALNLPRITDVRTLLSGATTALRSIPGIPPVVLSGFDAALNPRAWAADLTALTAGLLDSFVDLSPLDDARRVMAGFRQIASLFAAPVRVNTIATANAGVGATLPLVLTRAARQSAADAAVAACHLQLECATTMAAAARRVLASEAAQAQLTPAEIEETANAARASLEAAIVAWRSRYPVEVARPVIEGMRDTARLVQTSAQRLILRRPPLINHLTTAPVNMRLLAHRLYGDHTRATELMRLNNYGRTPVLEAGETLKVYAQ